MKAASSDLDISAEFEKVSKEVKKKIESACSTVLRKDIYEAEKWIEERQASIKEQISNVEQAESETRRALEAANTFSSAEIDKQVQGIKNKKAALE